MYIDVYRPQTKLREGNVFTLVVCSQGGGGEHWRPVQTCSDRVPPHEWHLVVASETEVRTASNWAVRIPLECFLVSPNCISCNCIYSFHYITPRPGPKLGTGIAYALYDKTIISGWNGLFTLVALDWQTDTDTMKFYCRWVSVSVNISVQFHTRNVLLGHWVQVVTSDRTREILLQWTGVTW